MKTLILILSFIAFSFAWAKESIPAASYYRFKEMNFKLDPYVKTSGRALMNRNKEMTNLSVYPQTVDLADIQTEVKTQGDRGSCAFFTTNALLESLIKQKQGIEVNLSEEYLIWKVKGDLKIRTDSEGSLAHENVDGIVKGGVLLERDLPFSPSWFSPGMPCGKIIEGQSLTPSNCYSHNEPSQNLKSKILDASAFVPEIYNIDLEKIIEIMAQDRQPVIVGVPVHPKGWNSQTGEAVMTDAMAKECNATLNLCGGHSILLVGYDMVKRLFTFKNSWSSLWGKSGYGTISFDYVSAYARNKIVTGSLKSPMTFPRDYSVFPDRRAILKVANSENVTSRGRNFLTSIEALLDGMDNSTLYISMFYVYPKTGSEIAENNMVGVPVLPDFQGQYGKSARGNFYKVMSDDSNPDYFKSGLLIPVSVLKTESLKNKNLFLRLSSYYYSDTKGWVNMTREFEKLGVLFQ